MPNSIFDSAVQTLFDQAGAGQLSLFPSPEDWRDTPIYFLMVDRFNNTTKPPATMPYDAFCNTFQGGTLAGITAQLQYIRDMGFGAIWLSPVFKNPIYDLNAYHGYGIQNFLAIEPRFASSPGSEEADLKKLVDTAHNLGLYIILDIVLHHAGNVFTYALPDSTGGFNQTDTLNWTNTVQDIFWKNANGSANLNWSQAPVNPPLDAAIWPSELCSNQMFVCKGQYQDPAHLNGDFDSDKGINLDPNSPPNAQSILIRCYQYIIAKFDIDGFRIDTLKFIPQDYERVFGNAMREFALSVGKKNFFTFGEVWDTQTVIDEFIGRNTMTGNAPVGVDAAVDYPLFNTLPAMIKGENGQTANSVAQMFQNRKNDEESILTSHGEAGQYFVIFLDNHDQYQRFGYTGPAQLTNQIILGLASLFTLPGIPCVYYGTEQGLSGHKSPGQTDDSMVREALWGKPNPFDTANPLYVAIKNIFARRAQYPALRYGRYYFRPVSGDHVNFAISTSPTGILSFSRILNDSEILVAVNTDFTYTFTGDIIVDSTLNSSNPAYTVLYSNLAGATTGTVTQRSNVNVAEVDGSITHGPVSVLPMNLRPQEIQILSAS